MSGFRKKRNQWNTLSTMKVQKKMDITSAQTANETVKCRRYERRQLSKLNSKAVVPDAGFCIFQMPAFPLPALSFTSGIILDAILI